MNQNIQQAVSTQKFLEIKEIKEGVLVLKNGALRAVLMASSINFALKSIDEQDALTYKYQEFLNSLDFPVQILIQSRKLNIKPYLEVLEKARTKQKEELLRVQTSEYIDFIRNLTELTDIMTKIFYVIIPFAIGEARRVGFGKKMGDIFSSQETASSAGTAFKEYKDQLWQRVDLVSGVLGGAGIKTVPLNTQELIELFYTLYNPEAMERKGLVDVKELNIQ